MLGSVCSTTDMRAWEVNSASLGVPTRLLMENAGATVARVVLERFKPRRVAVVAGVGGKAGDGFVAARHLATAGVEVRVLLVYRRGLVTHPDAVDALKALEASGVEVVEDYWRWPSDWLEWPDVIVDALLGTGVRGRVRSPLDRVIEAINSSGKPVVSIDVPSGVDPDTGEILGVAVRAAVTVTMHCIKKGLTLEPGKSHAGEVIVANIGLPRDAWLYVGPGDLEARLPRPEPWARKGLQGRVLVVGGSRSFYGAPWIAAMAALAAGADLVYLAAPEPVFTTIQTPEVIPVRLTGERLTIPHVQKTLTDYIDLVDVVLVGPGLGLDRESLTAARLVVKQAIERGKLVVIDADGLKALAGYETEADRVSSLARRAVITPHAGEASILLGRAVRHDSLEDRVKAAQELASRLNTVVLLKGAVDVIAEPGGGYRLNRRGHPDMTVGGTGDVLAGVTAALLAQTRDPYVAAQLAAYVTGVAGERAVDRHGRASPLNLIREIPLVVAPVKYQKA